MSSLVRLRPRPDTIYVAQNRTVLSTATDGFVHGGPQQGLFVYQARVLSRYRYTINGKTPEPVSLSNVEQHSWLGYYIFESPNPDSFNLHGPLGPGGRIAEETIELRLARFVADGVHEDVDVTNFTPQPVSLVLAIDADADFADLAETSGTRQQKGELSHEWRKGASGAWEMVWDYRIERNYDQQGESGSAKLHRGVSVRVTRSSSAPREENGSLRFAIDLVPQGRWHACIDIVPFVEGASLAANYVCRSFGLTDHLFDRKRMAFLESSARVVTGPANTLAPVVEATLDRARSDLAALRLHDLDTPPRGFVPAAGLPVYLALFGRDTLTAAWQSAAVSSDVIRGALRVIADRQGTTFRPWRDEEPGRMVHQAETNPLAVLNFNPNALNYFTVTTAAFYPLVLATLWHWTGDRALIGRFIDPALKALAWLDKYSDPNGDGFYEYQTKSKDGVTNQAWKDSVDAIVDEDGRDVEAPIAACEQQGYVYAAKLMLSEVLWWLDNSDEARRLYQEAIELKRRFNDAFWMPDDCFVALGLGPDRRQIRSIGSNAGHCIATGIVEDDLVKPTMERLLAADMFTGWGIRTLSSRNPAFNPYSYHRGSVWPVEHGSIAIGSTRYGLHEATERIARAQFEAAALFEFQRLPELLGGHERNGEHPFPPVYPRANSPQAWSASAVFCLVQAMLGLYPYAPLNMLLVDPQLPAWLPDITLENLHVGGATASIRFYRDGERSAYTVLDVRGSLHVVRQPSPWSLTAAYGERVKDLLSSFLPAH